MNHELPPLPYEYHALEPVISASTLERHHRKHHAGYLAKVRALIAESEVAHDTLEGVVKWSAARRAISPEAGALFNNAAQAWNHGFYWRSLRPPGQAIRDGTLARRIKAQFGGKHAFAEEFKAAATAHFGSGWAWLVAEAGELRIVTTGNAETPIAGTAAPLLVIDVWEHAYYLDYQERRAAHVEAVVDQLLDWDFAERNYREATRAPEPLPAVAFGLFPGI